MKIRAAVNARFISAAVLLLATAFAAAASGCARTSPAVGTWTASQMGQQMTLTLNPDGTGTLTPPPMVGGPQPMKWTEKDNAVTLTRSDAGTGNGGAQSGSNISGTLSEDKKSMAFSFTLSPKMPPLNLTFQKQADAK